jgi:endonuclease YncB( thermonuclease family)
MVNVGPGRPLVVPRLSLLVGLLLLAACRGPSWRATFEARVVGVTDGDTIVVLRDLNSVKVRLNGIDCPEKGQPFGSRAKLLTSEFSFGRAVTIVPRSRDQYGRIVADVVLPDGRVLNRELVAAGLAWHYTKYSKDEELVRLERQARAARIGLWSEERTVAPWDFRAGKRREGR